MAVRFDPASPRVTALRVFGATVAVLVLMLAVLAVARPDMMPDAIMGAVHAVQRMMR